jgi:hypothetical protein
MVAYIILMDFHFPLIYGLAKITIVEVIMRFWQVFKVGILKNLSWFLYVWGEVSVFLRFYCQKSRTTTHDGIKECPN